MRRVLRRHRGAAGQWGQAQSGKSEHAFDDGEVLGIIEHVAHKGLIDFENVDGEPLEKGQRGVARAEVIERAAFFASGMVCIALQDRDGKELGTK
jgi:hypothetical protein